MHTRAKQAHSYQKRRGGRRITYDEQSQHLIYKIRSACIMMLCGRVVCCMSMSECVLVRRAIKLGYVPQAESLRKLVDFIHSRYCTVYISYHAFCSFAAEIIALL